MKSLIDIFVGRQPIFNTQMQVVAYELLFRGNSEDNRAVILGGDAATAQVMMNAFGDIGLADVVGEHKAYINFTEGLLVREYQPFFPRKKVVIEVLEDVKVTPLLMSSLKALKDQGFTIALDDYVFNPELEPLEELADIVKVDILQVGPKKLAEHAARLKTKGLLLLAEKVESREQYDFCVKLGFDLFQGYFFAKPKIIQGQRLPTNKLSVLELLASVYDPDIDMHRLSAIVGKDVVLSQKLLKLVAQSDPKGPSLKSIHDAVLRFGLNRLKSWASMLVLSGVDDKPLELFTTSLIRARFCELVAEKLGAKAAGGFSRDTYFTVGLFSSLDALMDTELSQLLEKLSLETALQDALLQGTGIMGVVLLAVKSLEQGSTDFVLPGDLSGIELSKLYLQAMQFAESLKF